MKSRYASDGQGRQVQARGKSTEKDGEKWKTGVLAGPPCPMSRNYVLRPPVFLAILSTKL